MLAMEASSSTRHRHEVSRTPRRSYDGRFEPSSGAQRLLLSGWVAGVPRTAHGRRRNEKGGSADAEPALHFDGAEAPPYDRNAGLTRPAPRTSFYSTSPEGALPAIGSSASNAYSISRSRSMSSSLGCGGAGGGGGSSAGIRTCR